MSSSEKEISRGHDDPEVQEYNGNDAIGEGIIANEVVEDSKDMYRMGKNQQFRRIFRMSTMIMFTSLVQSTWEVTMM